jgi:hypothetical protein
LVGCNENAQGEKSCGKIKSKKPFRQQKGFKGLEESGTGEKNVFQLMYERKAFMVFELSVFLRHPIHTVENNCLSVCGVKYKNYHLFSFFH